MNTTEIALKVETEGFNSLLIYGLFADALLIAPILTYVFWSTTRDFTTNTAQGFERWHQDYISMLAVSYAPIGIMWLVTMAQDSPFARRALAAAVEIAGVGSLCMVWLGLASYLMKLHQYEAINIMTNYYFAAGYGVLNVALVIMHYYLAPPIFNWILEAPLPVKEQEKSHTISDDQDWDVQAKKELQEIVQNVALPDKAPTAPAAPVTEASESEIDAEIDEEISVFDPNSDSEF